MNSRIDPAIIIDAFNEAFPTLVQDFGQPLFIPSEEANLMGGYPSKFLGYFDHQRELFAGFRIADCNGKLHIDSDPSNSRFKSGNEIEFPTSSSISKRLFRANGELTFNDISHKVFLVHSVRLMQENLREKGLEQDYHFKWNALEYGVTARRGRRFGAELEALSFKFFGSECRDKGEILIGNVVKANSLGIPDKLQPEVFDRAIENSEDRWCQLLLTGRHYVLPEGVSLSVTPKGVVLRGDDIDLNVPFPTGNVTVAQLDIAKNITPRLKEIALRILTNPHEVSELQRAYQRTVVK